MKQRLSRKAFIAGPPAVALAATNLPAFVAAAPSRVRARPGTARWPGPSEWQRLRASVGGRLIRIDNAFVACTGEACDALFRSLKNPYYINEHPNVTQTLGWLDAWKSEPSVYAVEAESSADVAAAVRFAQRHDLRLVVRGGAHSYQGTSNAPDSLMIWTRRMHEIVVHDAFVPRGCNHAPLPAVSVGPGNIWLHVYDAVTTQHGRYVQGGGCTTVGVAGFISGGGFGSWSKRYGTGAGSLLEAEVVTADGNVRIANACRNADLFWAIKGGGGSSLGVLTRLTLQTHELPDNFGIVIGAVKANSDSAFRRLIERFVAFYATQLHNEHWGEQAAFRPQNVLELTMLFQGLDQEAAQRAWQPLLSWIAASPQDFTWARPLQILAVPARHFWDTPFVEEHFGWAIAADKRAGAGARDFWWGGNTEEAGQFLHEYRSLWLPDSLLDPPQQARLADALFTASRHWHTTLHCNKGLSGAPPDAIARSRDTAMNPKVLDAFALAIMAMETDGVYPGLAGHEPNVEVARETARSVRAAYDELRRVAPDGGSYVSEASYFDEDWQRAYWGEHYARLLAVKRRYDPTDLFIVHHGVGSERWSRDGFTKLT